MQPPDTAVDNDSGDTKPGTAHALGRVSAIALAAGSVAACGGGDGGTAPPPIGSPGPTPTPTPPPPVVLKPESDAQAARFALHASLSVSPADIETLREDGYLAWLDAKMARDNDQSGAQFLKARGFEKVDTRRWYNSASPGDAMIWSQLMQGGSGVRKRAALAMSEFFVVSLNSINMAWRSSAITAYWDTLNEHAFGNFRDLIEDISLNPAMGVFLNTRGNRKADDKGRVPDENYGREIMQLFSIGLVELNRDGTVKTGSDGKPIETYTNNDVTGIAKAFTGYDFDFKDIGFTTEVGGTRQVEDAEYAYASMTADSSRWRYNKGRDFHSGEEKKFLGVTIPAGTGPVETLRITHDTLFNHPNVAPFFSKQMIQRLVTSNPSPAYVDRVAAVFENNGSGTRGDLGAVFRAIWMDEEARSETTLNDPTFGKIREPIVRLAQWGRTFGAASAGGNWELGDMSNAVDRLGQSPLRSPSVFNFFRPGYVPQKTETSARGLVAPEMQIVNETSVAGYVNFMERMVEGRGYFARDVKAAYTQELAIAHDAQALLDRLDLLLTGMQLADDTRSAILSALEARPAAQGDADDVKLRRIHTGVFLVMISNDYTVQR
ncbi:hypothetical protein AAW01_11755 [Aurantiacibacter gangjinensis]|uniref:Uncharacterized protein n=1 Tax=Aurantiacibacter gangjinensis TaxID=502682 RepID=A0A0G9MNZ7_9SPHN|nr:hypothetical protein AAW01_11755 [Aurantiacibacter gangjinensis]